jgi:hypothetical protein
VIESLSAYPVVAFNCHSSPYLDRRAGVTPNVL